MPKRKLRAALYVRESDESLINSTTIDSAAKAVRDYIKKEGYELSPTHEYIEAISAYSVAYFNREKLMAMLKAAERHEFDVLVITEVRALSRKGAGEVLVIYDMLQKYNVKLETITEKFSDDPIGEMVLTFKATYARLEREQSYLRMQRGKTDRIILSGAPNAHPHPAYGYKFIDTAREVKGAYAFDHTIIFVDADGVEWSTFKVACYIFELLKKRVPIRQICDILNKKNIPPPKKPTKNEPHWINSTISMIARNPIYKGEVYANKYKKINKLMTKVPKDQWVLLPNPAPVLIDAETFDAIQVQLTLNKEEALRNNNRFPKDLGLLRGKYIRCGICGHSMTINYPSKAAEKLHITAIYRCYQTARQCGTLNNHNTMIHQPLIDKVAWEKVVEILSDPNWVRLRVEELRRENKPTIDVTDVESTIEKLRRSMQNLFRLAQEATDDETMVNLTERMKELEQQKRVCESFLYDASDDQKERVAVEAEIVKFETWADTVRPFLTDPDYCPTYEEKRLAIRVIGIKAIIYPTKGDYPFRHRIIATVPAVLAKLNQGSNQSNNCGVIQPP